MFFLGISPHEGKGTHAVSKKIIFQFMRITALTVFMIVMCSGLLMAKDVDAQDLSAVHISLKVEGQSLEFALKEIEKATGFRFAYKKEMIAKYKSLQLKESNRSVAETLKLLLSFTDLTYEQQKNYILIKQKPVKQIVQNTEELKITGTIKDQLDKVMPGVNVKNINSGKTVLTNEQGFYTIVANTGDVLEFSSVGFNTQQVTIAERIVINLTLEAVSGSLNDVVVVGYGQQKKITTIGAQTTIKVAEIKQPVANLSTVLAGRVAGIIGVQRSGEPGYDNADIWIRGISTFTNSSPLILVDGVERSFNNIDPEDIESFSILKDASATAVYGVRGANGVILITLKKGKAGAPSINLQVNKGITEFTKIPGFADGVTYMRMANEAYSNSNPGAVNPLYSDEAIQKTADGSDPDLYPNVNWFKEMFNKTGNNQRVNLNVNGGSETAKYYLSLSYYDEKGLYKVEDLSKYNYGVKFNRFNFTSNLNLKIT